MRPTWVLVVCSAMTRVSLISALDRPRAISLSTSVSRLVSAPSAPVVAGGGPTPRWRAEPADRRPGPPGGRPAAPAAAPPAGGAPFAAGGGFWQETPGPRR